MRSSSMWYLMITLGSSQLHRESHRHVHEKEHERLVKEHEMKVEHEKREYLERERRIRDSQEAAVRMELAAKQHARIEKEKADAGAANIKDEGPLTDQGFYNEEHAINDAAQGGHPRGPLREGPEPGPFPEDPFSRDRLDHEGYNEHPAVYKNAFKHDEWKVDTLNERKQYEDLYSKSGKKMLKTKGALAKFKDFTGRHKSFTIMATVGSLAMASMAVILAPFFLGSEGRTLDEAWGKWLGIGRWKIKDGKWDVTNCHATKLGWFDGDCGGGADITKLDECGNYVDLERLKVYSKEEQKAFEANNYVGAPCLSVYYVGQDGTSDWDPNQFKGCPFGGVQWSVKKQVVFNDYDPIKKELKKLYLYVGISTDTYTDIYYDCHGNTVLPYQWSEDGDDDLTDTSEKTAMFMTDPNNLCADTSGGNNPTAEWSQCLGIWRPPKSCQQDFLTEKMTYQTVSPSLPKAYLEKCYQELSDFRLWKTMMMTGQMSSCLEGGLPCANWTLGSLNVIDPTPKVFSNMLTESELKRFKIGSSSRPKGEVIQAVFHDAFQYPKDKKDKWEIESWWCQASRDFDGVPKFDKKSEMPKSISYSKSFEDADVSELITKAYANFKTGPHCSTKAWIQYYKDHPDFPRAQEKLAFFSKSTPGPDPNLNAMDLDDVDLFPELSDDDIYNQDSEDLRNQNPEDNGDAVYEDNGDAVYGDAVYGDAVYGDAVYGDDGDAVYGDDGDDGETVYEWTELDDTSRKLILTFLGIYDSEGNVKQGENYGKVSEEDLNNMMDRGATPNELNLMAQLVFLETQADQTDEKSDDLLEDDLLDE